MIEYGLAISLESSPRTPDTPGTPNTPKTPKPMANIDSPCVQMWCCNAPLRRKLSFRDFVVDLEEEGENNESESISPRVLFMDTVNDDVVRRVTRRLDFSALSMDDTQFNLSPVTRFRSLSMTHDDSSRVSTIGKKEVCESNCDCSSCCVGECGVCYSNLPLRANHVFTLCGHLFCTRCLLKWWDTSTTCPICRAEIYDADADEAVNSGGTSTESDPVDVTPTITSLLSSNRIIY
ncbi:hypothetical protein EBU71_20050, partial [bacterium]|nr:hypothetical protein [Candidatus Elulimicrobium humile]